MICDACRAGAKQNKIWRAGGGAVFLDAARNWHALCTGCCCQHAVGADSLVVPA